MQYCSFHFYFQESLVRVPVHGDHWVFLGSLFCAIDARFSRNHEVGRANCGPAKVKSVMTFIRFQFQLLGFSVGGARSNYCTYIGKGNFSTFYVLFIGSKECPTILPHAE